VRVFPKSLNFYQKPKQLNARSKALKATSQSFRSLSELLFFACAKKSNQKKAHPGLRAPPATRSGSVPPAEFFDRTSLSCQKTRTSMCVALTGFTAGSTATALWGPKSGRAKTTATARKATATTKASLTPTPLPKGEGLKKNENQTPSNILPGFSNWFLTSTKNSTASLPSIIRWS